jgi:tetratricopeptide (TPR) repeat protein
MFDKSAHLNKLENIESTLSLDVFEIAKAINNDDHVFNSIFNIELALESESIKPDKKQSAAIARIFARFAWSLKFVGEHEDVVFNYLNIALKHAKEGSDEEAFCLYVKTTLLREYGKHVLSEKLATTLLEKQFKDKSLSRIHTLNCLGLAQFWHDKTDTAVNTFKKALNIRLDEDYKLTPVDTMIMPSEGDTRYRTCLNLAQGYSKKQNHDMAQNYAIKSIEVKVNSNRPQEDMAYAKIVIGEIYYELGEEEAAEKLLNKAINTYNELYDANVEVKNRNRAQVTLDKIVKNNMNIRV